MSSDLAAYLQQKATELGLSLRQMALLCKIPVSTFHGYWKGEHNPRPLEARKIAAGLGVPAREIFEHAGLPVPPEREEVPISLPRRPRRDPLAVLEAYDRLPDSHLWAIHRLLGIEDDSDPLDDLLHG